MTSHLILLRNYEPQENSPSPLLPTCSAFLLVKMDELLRYISNYLIFALDSVPSCFPSPCIPASLPSPFCIIILSLSTRSHLANKHDLLKKNKCINTQTFFGLIMCFNSYTCSSSQHNSLVGFPLMPASPSSALFTYLSSFQLSHSINCSCQRHQYSATFHTQPAICTISSLFTVP